MSNIKIDGQRIIVTGGAKGLGLDIAQALTEKNVHVVIVDTDTEAVNLIKGDYESHIVDLRNPKQCEEFFSLFSASKIDAIVNCAGLIYSEPLINLLKNNDIKHNHDTFCEVVSSNLHTVFLASVHAAENMIQHRTKGVIINFSSVAAQGNKGQTAYSAAKAGVEAMTKVWAKELGVFGIRAVAIAPGFIDANSTHRAISEQNIKVIKQKTPLRRLGSISDVTDSVLFALENSFLSGCVVPVDGGYNIE